MNYMLANVSVHLSCKITCTFTTDKDNVEWWLFVFADKDNIGLQLFSFKICRVCHCC